MADNKQQVAGLMREGSAAYGKGYVPQAINYFSQAAALDSSNELIYNARAMAYLKVNRFEEALEDAEKVIQLKRQWVKGNIRKGQALMGLERYEEAMMALMEGLDKDPTDKSIRNAITECRKHITGPFGGDQPMISPFADFKLWEKVEKHPITRQYLNQPDYREILQQLQKNPKDLQKYMEDARIMTTLGMLLDVDIEAPIEASGASATGPVHEVLPSARTGTASFEPLNPARPGPVITELPDDAEQSAEGFVPEVVLDDIDLVEPVKSTSGRKRARRRKKDKVLSAEVGGGADAPEQPEGKIKESGHTGTVKKADMDADLKAVEEKEKGNAAYKKREFETAIEHYTKAIELDPSNITYRTNRAAVYFEQHKYDDCIKECHEAIDVGRENRADFKFIAKAQARIGNAYLQKEDLDMALKYYEKSLSEHRTQDIVKKVAEVKKKIKERERLAYLDPEKSLEEKKSGNQAFQKGDYPAAIKFYTEAIKRNPDDAKIYSNRAACYTKLAEFNMALKDSEDCVRLDPTFVKGYLRKGGSLVGMKDFAKAKIAYQKAMELDAQCQEAIDGYRRCLEKMHDPSVVQQQVLNDPEVLKILKDPSMQNILSQMQEDPAAVREHLKNPMIAEKIQKLMESGLIDMRPM